MRVSVADDESQSSDSGTWGRISETGRYVTFTSQATDLVPGPDSFSTTDCFLRDITGKTTRRVSLTSGGGNPSGGRTMNVLRSTLFALALLVITPPYSLLALATAPLPRIWRYRIISGWSRIVIWPSPSRFGGRVSRRTTCGCCN